MVMQYLSVQSIPLEGMFTLTQDYTILRTILSTLSSIYTANIPSLFRLF